MLRRHRQLRNQVHQILDAGLFAIGLWMAHVLRVHWKLEILGGTATITPFENFVWLYLIIIPTVPLILESQGFYNRPLLGSRRAMLWSLLKGCVLTTMGVILVIFLFRSQQQVARSVIIMFGFTSFVLVLVKEEVVRWGMRSALGQSQLKRRVVLIGTHYETTKLRLELKAKDPEGVQIVRELDLNESSVDKLVTCLHDLSVNGVILNAKHVFFGQVEKVIQACELEGVEVWLVADFFKTQISRTTLDDFYGHPVLVFRSGPETSWQGVAKQVMDFSVALLFLLLMLVPMVVVALLIKISSPGPIFFCQKRSGLNGNPFTMYKFRSMVTNAEQLKKELEILNEMSGPVFKVANDPRITPIGKWLRKFSIDELPQFFNVLRGEMSLVGPRPLPVDEVNRFDDLAHRRRLSVKPGLTCLWQVSGRNQVKDFSDWVRLDLEYIDNWSLWLDLKILWQTVPVVLMAKGAR